jgi:hypothetical protein
MATFSWDISDSNPWDGFSTTGKQMQVISESRSKFPVSVTINGQKKDTVFPGQIIVWAGKIESSLPNKFSMGDLKS